MPGERISEEIIASISTKIPRRPCTQVGWGRNCRETFWTAVPVYNTVIKEKEQWKPHSYLSWQEPKKDSETFPAGVKESNTCDMGYYHMTAAFQMIWTI